MADLDPDIEKKLDELQKNQIGFVWSEAMREVARKFLTDPAARDAARDDLIRSQKSLICEDITGLPETDEVQEVLFKIQDLLVPVLPEGTYGSEKKVKKVAKKKKVVKAKKKVAKKKAKKKS